MVGGDQWIAEYRALNPGSEDGYDGKEKRNLFPFRCVDCVRVAALLCPLGSATLVPCSYTISTAQDLIVEAEFLWKAEQPDLKAHRIANIMNLRTRCGHSYRETTRAIHWLPANYHNFNFRQPPFFFLPGSVAASFFSVVL
jgi:hypothetical protein